MQHGEREREMMIEVARLQGELKAAQSAVVREKARADGAIAERDAARDFAKATRDAIAAANARAEAAEAKLRYRAGVRDEVIEAREDLIEREKIRANAAQEALAAARRECDLLGAAFMGLRETYGLVLAFAREVLGVLERGEAGHMLRVPDRTIKLLRCKDPIPTADDVLAEARAALAAPAAAAGEGKP